MNFPTFITFCKFSTTSMGWRKRDANFDLERAKGSSSRAAGGSARSCHKDVKSLVFSDEKLLSSCLNRLFTLCALGETIPPFCFPKTDHKSSWAENYGEICSFLRRTNYLSTGACCESSWVESWSVSSALLCHFVWLCCFTWGNHQHKSFLISQGGMIWKVWRWKSLLPASRDFIACLESERKVKNSIQAKPTKKFMFLFKCEMAKSGNEGKVNCCGSRRGFLRSAIFDKPFGINDENC